MDKKKKQLLDKVAQALQRRQFRGLTSQQIEKLTQTHLPATAQSTIKSQKVIRNRFQRPPKAIVPSAAIFVSGGIGDVLAVESFMSEEERTNLKTIYYATKKSTEIKELFSSFSNYTNLKHHEVIWSDFSTFWCFFSKGECIDKMRNAGMQIPTGLQKAKDISITQTFPDIISGNKSFVGSSALKHRIADISKFNLPESYLVTCPFSTDKRIKTRDFSSTDWNNLLEYLKVVNLKSVVINCGNDESPNSDRLINLSNKTTIPEAIEILKGSKAYVGIDSWLSVLAAQIFSWPYLMIKSNNRHCIDNWRAYFSPQTTTNFLVHTIVVPDELK
jgi:hypothetical protein